MDSFQGGLYFSTHDDVSVNDWISLHNICNHNFFGASGFNIQNSISQGVMLKKNPASRQWGCHS